MTGGYNLIISGQDLCTNDTEILSVESAQAVTTDGLFLTHDGQLLPYHCVDTLVRPHNNHQLVAVQCLSTGCSNKGYCVPKCCMEGNILLDSPEMCTPVQSPHQAWTSQGKLYDHKLQILPHNIHVEYSYHFLDNYHKYNSCEQVTVLDRTEDSSFLLIGNGSLYDPEHGLTQDFCIDNRWFLEIFLQVVLGILKEFLEHSKRQYSPWQDCPQQCLCHILPHSLSSLCLQLFSPSAWRGLQDDRLCWLLLHHVHVLLDDYHEL